MQNAKDTFFEVMRTRLAAVNPERTVVVRGAVRPAVVVEENEMATENPLLDCFRLRWLSDAVNSAGAMPMVTMSCEIAYQTAGTTLNAGMDRGRVLAAMDAELMAMVNASPQSAVKQNYAALARGGSVMPMTTNVWWSDAALGKVTESEGALQRVATVSVMAYQEAGEL